MPQTISAVVARLPDSGKLRRLWGTPDVERNAPITTPASSWIPAYRNAAALGTTAASGRTRLVVGAVRVVEVMTATLGIGAGTVVRPATTIRCSSNTDG